MISTKCHLAPSWQLPMPEGNYAFKKTKEGSNYEKNNFNTSATWID